MDYDQTARQIARYNTQHPSQNWDPSLNLPIRSDLSDILRIPNFNIPNINNANATSSSDSDSSSTTDDGSFEDSQDDYVSSTHANGEEHEEEEEDPQSDDSSDDDDEESDDSKPEKENEKVGDGKSRVKAIPEPIEEVIKCAMKIDANIKANDFSRVDSHRTIAIDSLPAKLQTKFKKKLKKWNKHYKAQKLKRVCVVKLQKRNGTATTTIYGVLRFTVPGTTIGCNRFRDYLANSGITSWKDVENKENNTLDFMKNTGLAVDITYKIDADQSTLRCHTILINTKDGISMNNLVEQLYDDALTKQGWGGITKDDISAVSYRFDCNGVFSKRLFMRTTLMVRVPKAFVHAAQRDSTYQTSDTTHNTAHPVSRIDVRLYSKKLNKDLNDLHKKEIEQRLNKHKEMDRKYEQDQIQRQSLLEDKLFSSKITGKWKEEFGESFDERQKHGDKSEDEVLMNGVPSDDEVPLEQKEDNDDDAQSKENDDDVQRSDT
eukprot:224564_1